jgi:hypothetical protein
LVGIKAMRNNFRISSVAERNIQNWLPTFLASAFLVLGIAAFLFAFTTELTPCGNRFISAQAQCNVGDTETFTGPTEFQDTIAVGATPVVGTTGQILASRGAGTPPEWSNGETVTGVPVFAVKTADEAITNDAVLSVDADLQWTAIANSDYAVWGVLLASAGAVGTPDLRLRLNGPAASTHDCQWQTDNGVNTAWTTGNEAVTTDLVTTTAEIAFPFSCIAKTAGTAGTYSVYWAQNASDPNDMTLHKGSWLAWELLQ